MTVNLQTKDININPGEDLMSPFQKTITNSTKAKEE